MAGLDSDFEVNSACNALRTLTELVCAWHCALHQTFTGWKGLRTLEYGVSDGDPDYTHDMSSEYTVG